MIYIECPNCGTMVGVAINDIEREDFVLTCPVCQELLHG